MNIDDMFKYENLPDGKYTVKSRFDGFDDIKIIASDGYFRIIHSDNSQSTARPCYMLASHLDIRNEKGEKIVLRKSIREKLHDFLDEYAHKVVIFLMFCVFGFLFYLELIK